MKNKHVQRGITSYTKRLDREALGKTARIRKVDVETEEEEPKNDRKQANSGFQEKLRYVFAFFGIIIIAATASVIVSQIRNSKNAAEFVSTEEETLKNKHPSEPQAITIVENFIEALHISQWSDITTGNEEETQLAFSKLMSMKKNGWKKKSIQHLGPRQTPSGFVDSTAIVDQAGSIFVVNLLPHESTWKVDPGSSLQIHSKQWSEFFIPTSTSGKARVILTDDGNYYNGIYDDEKLWHAYTLKYHDDLPSIVGYCKRGSSADAALQNVLKQSASIQCVLSLHREVEAESAQYEIENVVSSDWVANDTIFSDQFIDRSLPSPQEKQAK